MGEPAIRRATVEDAEAIGAVLGRAFDDDPAIDWLIRHDELRAEHIATLFRVVTRHAYLADGESWVFEDGSGASVWRAPGVGEPNAIPEIEEAWPRITNLEHTADFAFVESKHPTEPDHYYLFAIGVEPTLQGGGRGSRLIRANLDRCDAEGIPAYLENTKERNLRFYEAHGFRVRERLTLGTEGPPIWLMWREPDGSR